MRWFSSPGRREAPTSCEAPPVDPRLAELEGSDATDPRIEVTSDSGDLGREGDAILKGNVRIRTGQRLLTADEASINATDRSIELKGNVEYLDPRLHVRGTGGNFDGQGHGQFSGAEFALLERNVRGSARDASVRDKGRMELEDVLYTAARSAATTGSCARARSSSIRRRAPAPVAT